MHLSYGGIEFEILRIQEFFREGIATPDGVTPLYIRHAIQTTCYLNEDVTRIPMAASKSPVMKDRWLREHLGKPRQKLLVWLDSGPGDGAIGNAAGAVAGGIGGAFGGEGVQELILESPAPDMPCDALNGPRCTIQSIDHTVGNRDIILNLTFETHLVACKSGSTTQLKKDDSNTAFGAVIGAAPFVKEKAKNNISIDTALLANRWSWNVDHNEQHLATHIIEGEAYFRLDYLRKLNVTGDMLRPIFIHPIPLGFKRVPPKVWQSSDGSVIKYRIQDEEQMMNFPGGVQYNAVSIEVQTSQEYTVPNDFKVMTEAGVRAAIEQRQSFENNFGIFRFLQKAVK